jgi:hypothetical protein
MLAPRRRPRAALRPCARARKVGLEYWSVEYCVCRELHPLSGLRELVRRFVDYERWRTPDRGSATVQC